MSQNYVVPNIYHDLSNQSQGFFAFRFVCQHCSWQIETPPVRSTVATVSNIADIGIGLLGGIWGRAASAGQQLYGSQWHTEQANALQKSWAEVQHQFHYCPRCANTVCQRCFNVRLNLCTFCAPDLKADGAQFQHGLNIDAQRHQIEEQYHAPQFNVGAIPSAATPDLVTPVSPVAAQLPPPGSQALLASVNTPGYPATVMCPTCRRMGPPGKFCQDCGTKLPFPDLFCPGCAVQVESGTRFCTECGTRLQP